jgi:uncharacterized protein
MTGIFDLGAYENQNASMRDNIPQRVKASGAVAHASTWQGSLPIAKLLIAVLAAGRDDGGAARLSGTVDAALPLVCQNCLKTFSWPLHLELELRLVSSEAEERRLLNECEPYLVEDDNLPLQALVEEEVLLALPIAPRCLDCGT